MSIFLTKVWGFDSPCGPLQFGANGWRELARAKIQPGDLVVHVGTLGPETDEANRGRILGIMEVTNERVLSIDFDLRNRSVDFNADKEYRWPFALLIRNAWRCPDRPLLQEISARPFHMDAAAGIVELTDKEAELVKRLRQEPVPVLSPIRVRARLDGEEIARRRGAPPPTTVRSGVMHLRRAPAYTYAMAIEGASQQSFKIGWAFDYKARQMQFNLSALPLLGGLQYSTVFHHLWDTARDAYNMEQAILRHFDAQRHPSNREVIHCVSSVALEAAWTNQLLGGKRP